MSDGTTLWLLGWGVVVGLDLATVPQVMVARPLVAAAVAGLLAGDVTMGLAVGLVLELFALNILPVGASRYPDYGLGAVAGVAAGAGAPDILGLGVAVAVGLLTAYLGELSITLVRRRNGADVRRQAAGLDRGDAATIRAVHRRGIGRDAVRAFAVTAVGLMIAAAVREWPVVTLRGAVLLTSVTIGVGVSVGVHGALRLAARRIGWFAAGLAGGLVWVLR